MIRIELKPNTILEGFADKREFDMKLYYLTFNAPSPYREGKVIPILYEGKTSDISEDIAQKCAEYYIQRCEYKNYNPDKLIDGIKLNGFNYATDSIKSSCLYEFCIIYNISQLKSTSDQKYCSMVGKGFCPYEYEDGKCKADCKCVNHITK